MLRHYFLFSCLILFYLGCDTTREEVETILHKNQQEIEVLAEAFYSQNKIFEYVNNGPKKYLVNGITIDLSSNTYYGYVLEPDYKRIEFQSFDEVLEYLKLTKREFFEFSSSIKEQGAIWVARSRHQNLVEIGFRRGLQSAAGLLYLPRGNKYKMTPNIPKYSHIEKLTERWYYYYE